LFLIPPAILIFSICDDARADVLPLAGTQNTAGFSHGKNDERHLIFAAKRDSHEIHDLEITFDHLGIGDAFKFFCLWVFHRIAIIHSIDLGRFDQNPAAELDRAEGGGAIGAEKRRAGSACENAYGASIKSGSSSIDLVKGANGVNLNGGKNLGRDSLVEKMFGETDRVHESRQHSDRIGPMTAKGGKLSACSAEEIAPAKNDRWGYPVPDQLSYFFHVGIKGRSVEPETGRTTEHLPA